jgi:hypothetical protein
MFTNANAGAVHYQPYFIPQSEMGGNIFYGNVEFENLSFYHNLLDMALFSVQNIKLHNIISINNPDWISISSFQAVTCKRVSIENSIFMGKYGTSDPQVLGAGLSMAVSQGGFPWSDSCRVDIINTVIANNYANSAYFQTMSSGISISDHVRVNLINSIIANNGSGVPQGSAIYMDDGGICDLYNSIVWNNRPYNVLMLDPDCRLTAHNSLLENAGQSFVYPSWLIPDGLLLYDNTNLDATAIPLFVGNGIHPFMPVSASDVIDAGSLVYPAGVSVPENDLAGNPRIYGQTIDLGPYEWQGTEFDFSFVQNGNLVTFIPSCNQPISDIHWDFNLDGIYDSDELMPTYSYTINDTFSVGCYINHGKSGITKQNYVVVTTAVDEQQQIPKPLQLLAWPNPFHGQLDLLVKTSEKSVYSVSIYDLKGRLVKELTAGGICQAQTI